MDGITAGGRRIEDAEQVLNQTRSWRDLIAWVERGSIRLDRATFEELHAHVAHEEALEWGGLRTGAVWIAGTTHKPPDAHTLTARMKTTMFKTWARRASRMESISPTVFPRLHLRSRLRPGRDLPI